MDKEKAPEPTTNQIITAAWKDGWECGLERGYKLYSPDENRWVMPFFSFIFMFMGGLVGFVFGGLLT